MTPDFAWADYGCAGNTEITAAAVEALEELLGHAVVF